MERKEMLEFLNIRANNDFYDEETRNKFKEIHDFIEKNTKEEIKNVTKDSTTTETKLIHNEIFPNGKNYEIYTDGGCLVNPGGPGGYGIVILEDGVKKTFNQGFVASTNNRMELRGPIKALSMIPEGSNVTLYSDSSYFSNPFNKNWIETWLKTDWKKGTIKNIDLWKELINVYNKHHVEIIWVKGHADNIYNEECDKLATEAYSNTSSLIKDEGFED